MRSFLDEFQERIEAHLNTHSAFKDVPVISHKQSDHQQCLDELVQSGMGTCVVIKSPLPQRIVPTQKQLAFEDLLIRVQVIESPCINTSAPSALVLAEAASHVLHHFSPNIPKWDGWLELCKKKPWLEPKDPQSVGRYIIEVQFNAIGSTQEAHESRN